MARSWLSSTLVAALLPVAAGCAFESSPLFSQAGADAETEPDARVEPTSSSPWVASDAAVASGSAQDAGTDASTPNDAGRSGSVPVVDAAAPASVDACAAGCGVSPPPAACDPVGSYGLMVSADVDWDPTTWIDLAGRGPAQFLMLAQVDAADPLSHVLNGSGRVCDLALPPMGSSLSCAPFELEFADSLWEQSAVPKLPISGSYNCDSSGCVLEIAPTSYALGLAVDPMKGTGSAPDASVAMQFPDDDADGFPGVSVSVVASKQSSPACAVANGSNCSEDEEGFWTPNPAARFRVGLRAQLLAALHLSSDCQLGAVSGSMPAVELRAAGCGWETSYDGGMPTSCSDELRSMIDQNLPRYRVLGAGDAPSASSSCRDTAPSRGTIVRAVRIPKGVGSVTCQQLRAMF